MRVTISVPDDVFHQAESLAQRMGLSVEALFRKSVESFVLGNAYDEVTEALNQVYAEESSKVDEALTAMQWASLPKERW